MKSRFLSRNSIVLKHRQHDDASAGGRLSLASREQHNARSAPSAHLTGRQLQVLALLCEGLSNKLICRRLNISSGTVKAHISSILRELGVASRLQAVVVARSQGLVRDFTDGGDGEDGSEVSPDGYTAVVSDRRFGHGRR
jgi:DNA-binding NarL/FixJ family response regulator